MLPPGPFGCILADPPWRFATFSEKGRGRCPDGKRTNGRGNFTDGLNNAPERHYVTMTLEDIAALPVAASAARDCVLLMWAVDPMLPQALDVGRAWGFTYKTTGFVWAKERRLTSARGNGVDDLDLKRFPIGTGYWTRSNPEICLLFTCGKPKRLSAAVRKLLIAPRREHSRKPDEQYERIEALVGGPYLELFARTSQPGWTSWGNETDKFEAEAPILEELMA